MRGAGTTEIGSQTEDRLGEKMAITMEIGSQMDTEKRLRKKLSLSFRRTLR